MTKENLRTWQRHMRFTQANAAKSLGVSLSTYKDWINGKSRNTGLPVSIDLRTALACSAIAKKISPWQ